MFTIHTEQLKISKKGRVSESDGAKWLRTTCTLAVSSTLVYPLIRGWTAYVSQYEYMRQETGKIKMDWMDSRYRGTSEVLWKTLRGQGMVGWFRGLGPFITLSPIVSLMHIARSNMKKDVPYKDEWSNNLARAAISGSTAIATEFLCFPLRCAFILMASESHNLPQPRPTARQVLTDLLKFGGRNRTLQLAFVPSALASILSTLPDATENQAVSILIAAYITNLISMRLIIASLPGAPRPYKSISETISTHFRSSPRTWLVGALSFMTPFIATAFMRTTIDSYYYAYLQQKHGSSRK